MNLPQLIAHRGASGYAPENTIEAFELAAQQGASWVELDVQLTQDLVPIVCHDEGLLRLAQVDAPVCEFSLTQIKQLEVGSWFDSRFKGIQIPTLEEALLALQRLGLAVNIELKPNYYTGNLIAKKVIELLNDYEFYPGTDKLISSMHIQVLQQFAALLPPKINLPQAWIVKRWNPNWLAVAQAVRDLITIHLDYSLLTASRIKEMHQAGYRVLAFTVNDIKMIKSLKHLGVDGFFTDYIGCLSKQMS